MIKLKQFLNFLDCTDEVTLCYASNGRRLYKGPLDTIPEHLLEYYVTLAIPKTGSMYLEIHERESFREE